MAVLIPFTGGVESTYLVQKALADGHEVIVAYYGVTQHGKSRLSELTARRHMIEYWNRKYPDKVWEVYGFMENMAAIPRQQKAEKNGVRQQWNVINQIAATISSLNVEYDRVMSVWIGWTQYDSTAHSLCYNDLTPEEYQRLTKLVPEILFLSNIDKSQRTPFMPLWNEKSKADVYNKIDDELKQFIVANGVADSVASTQETLHHKVHNIKKEEYGELPLNATFARAKLNYLEQAMIDAFFFSEPVDIKHSGYADLFEDVPNEHLHTFAEIISAHILSKPEKIHLYNPSKDNSFDRRVANYANVIKTMAGWKKPELLSSSKKEETIDAA